MQQTEYGHVADCKVRKKQQDSIRPGRRAPRRKRVYAERRRTSEEHLDPVAVPIPRWGHASRGRQERHQRKWSRVGPLMAGPATAVTREEDFLAADLPKYHLGYGKRADEDGLSSMEFRRSIIGCCVTRRKPWPGRSRSATSQITAAKVSAINTTAGERFARVSPA